MFFEELSEMCKYPPEPKVVGECANGNCKSELYKGFEYYEYDGDYFCDPECVTDKLLDLRVISAVEL